MKNKYDHHHITFHIEQPIYDKLKIAGKALNDFKNNGKNFEISIKIDPDDLMPVHVQEEVQHYIKSALYALSQAPLAYNVHVTMETEIRRFH